MESDSPELRRQAHLDLTMRARSGMAIYLVSWLISAVWAGIYQINPLFFIINTVLLALVSIMRLVHYRTLKGHPELNGNGMHFWLVGMILFSALHWGVLSVWIIFVSDYPSLHYPFLILLPAFAVGGAAILSISRVISVLYPLFILMPSMIAGLAIGGGESLLLVTLAAFSIFYVFEASRVSHNDYWDSIRSHKVAEERAKAMEQLSITDPLTGLYNRMHFNRKFLEEWRRCSRYQLPLTVIMIDLDHFKSINDSFGHLAGDQCLKTVSSVFLREFKRVTDFVARYGGEEFVVMLVDRDMEAASGFAERLINAVSEIKVTWEGELIPLRCSIGLASTVPEKEKNKDALLMAADKALYQSKERGRNRYTIAEGLTPSLPASA